MIFLSVGYSTCHWCHVMERESFENEEVNEEMFILILFVKHLVVKSYRNKKQILSTNYMMSSGFVS